MTNLIIGLCVYLLANLWWIYKANNNLEHYKRTCTPSNPFRVQAEGSLNMSLLSFTTGALALLVLLLGGSS